MRQFFISILFALCLIAHAAEVPVLADPASAKRYDAFTHGLKCLKCEHQSIAESDSDFAKDVKTWVADAILVGRSDQEIKDMLQSRFGDRIFLDPPWQMNTYLLWLLPVLLALFGLGIWWSKLKK
jgi:cytochrome c-type biogenesis protein CcmH/NrfF